MKIAHIGLAAYFTDGMTYQDNYLTEQNLRDGHEVLYISNAAKYVDGEIVETGYEDRVLPSGLRLVRLPYVRVLGRFFSEKFRKVRGLYGLLRDFGPDVILTHNLCFWSVRDVIRYKKEHPAVKLYADTHTDYYTSGTNWLSRAVLHRVFYRYLTKISLPYVEKLLYIAPECRDFAMREYGVPKERLEYYPLGGEIFSDAHYREVRASRRGELGMQADELLLLHAGKLEPEKRTADLLTAFSAVPQLHAKLAVIGSIPTEQRDALLEQMARDPRVVYLGWRSAAELEEYLCACDLYCQPGKQSAIMENSLCCHCPVLSYPHTGYQESLSRAGFIWAENVDELTTVFRQLSNGEIPLEELSRRSTEVARTLLDYRVLAARLYR